MSAPSRSGVRHSDSLTLVWRLSEVEAQHMGEEYLGIPHFFLGVLKFSDLNYEKVLAPDIPLRANLILECSAQSERLLAVFNKCGLEARYCRRRLREVCRAALTHAGAVKTQHLRRDKTSRKMFATAESLASADDGVVFPIHLLEAILQQEDGLCSAALTSLKIDGKALASAVKHELDNPTSPTTGLMSEPKKLAPPKPAVGSFLEKWGRDLTRLARENRLEPVIGRSSEVRSLAQCLVQKQKSSVILIGDPGVGKTVIVEALAQKLASPDAPPDLKDIRLVELNISSILAGTSYRGEFEERLNRLIREAEADPNLVYFIDEIHTIVGAGRGSGALDAANQLKPALARGDLTVIGATTTGEYRKWIEPDHALQRRFHTIWVEEPSRAEALQIVRGVATRLQEHHNLVIREDAIISAVDLSIRYLPELRLPDKAIDLIDQACAQARFQTLSAPLSASGGLSVKKEDIQEVVSARCKIPVSALGLEEEVSLLNLEEALGRRVKGQDEAIRVVADALRLAKAGLRDPHRPLGVFLFVGPTGTGKTELAKAIAEQMFGKESAMIRLDMSEFMEAHSISKLIGAPPGFIGHDHGGQLTDKILDQPYALILFDEIDKAHPRVLDILLQLLDEATLTDASGRKASVANAVIVMTMNASGEAGTKHIGFGERDAPADSVASHQEFNLNLVNAVKALLRPELVNRIGHIVPFHSLSAQDIQRIIEKILGRLNQQLESRNLKLVLDSTAYEWVGSKGFHPEYGARGLERAFEEIIAQPLARKLLERDLISGKMLTATVGKDGVKFIQ
jgi:ATP-dependent Clp protease ATP-binding subunit ClpC